MSAIKETNFQFPNLEQLIRGKVRDIYLFPNKIALVASDRISAFDVILPEPIPYKGQVLNQIAAYFLEATKDIVPNWVTATPDPNATIGLRCTPYAVEMVVRAYLVGHAWREYKAGKRQLCGVPLPDGLNENDKLPHPIITPTTKAEEGGKDMDISREEIIKQGIVKEDEYIQLEKYSLALFERGTQMAKEKELLLIDTKYEFGKHQDKIYLIDEIHTPDSSRYFYSNDYEERIKKQEKPKQLSKEFVREWLMSHGFQGKETQQIPAMTTEVIDSISNRYIELYENITGKAFKKEKKDTVLVDRIQQNILSSLE